MLFLLHYLRSAQRKTDENLISNSSAKIGVNDMYDWGLYFFVEWQHLLMPTADPEAAALFHPFCFRMFSLFDHKDTFASSRAFLSRSEIPNSSAHCLR